MTSNTRHLVYKLFYKQHLAPSQIDRRLSLVRGTARAEIAASWLLEIDEIHLIAERG